MEAKRNIREQIEYLQEPQDKKRSSRVDSGSKNDDMQRILTYSIQKAKEKMHHIDSSIQQGKSQDYNTSRCDDHYASVNTVDSKDVSTINQIKNCSQSTEIRKPATNGSWSDQNSTAIANAMKCLQSKILELEGRLNNVTVERDNLS
jgi:hypothetical protein